MIKAIRTMLS